MATDDLAAELARTIANLFADAENRLLEALARQVRQDVIAQGEPVAMAYAHLRQRTQAVLDRLQSDASGEAARALLTAWATGASAAVDELNRLGGDRRRDWLARRSIIVKAINRLLGITRRREMRLAAELADLRTALPGIDAIMVAVGELTQRFSSTHLHVLRWQQDVYRQTVAAPALGVLAGTRTRLQAAQVMWDDLTARGITGFTDRSGRDWELASYTEMATRTAAAQSLIEGHLDQLRRAGVELAQVSNSPEECPICRPFEGKTIALVGPAGPRQVEHGIDDGHMVTVDVYDTLIGATAKGLFHPNCFPGHVEVSAPSGVRAADSRWYEGPVVVIHTAGGDELPVTPNHPILTPEGWVPAGQLKEGDHVLRHRGDVETATQGAPGDVQVPARISEVFDALRKSSTMTPVRVPVAPEQFHGDGLGSDVDVVLADGLLRDALDSEAFEAGREFELLDGRVSASALLTESTPLQVTEGAGHPANSLVGGSNLGGSLFCRHGGPASGAGRAALDAVAASQEDGTHGRLGSPHDLGDLVLSGTFEVQSDSVGDPPLVGGDLPVGGQALRFGGGASDSGLLEALVDPGGTDADSGRDLARALASEVAAEQVVKIDVRDFAGHVYNLQTGDGWYVAGGIVVSNCTHRLITFIPGVTRRPQSPGNPQGYEDRQRLREIERAIRRWKRREAAAFTPEAKQAAAKKVRAWQKAARELVASTDQPRSPEREQIDFAR